MFAPRASAEAPSAPPMPTILLETADDGGNAFLCGQTAHRYVEALLLKKPASLAIHTGRKSTVPRS